MRSLHSIALQPPLKVSDHVEINYSRRIASHVNENMAEWLDGQHGVVMKTILTKDNKKGAIVLVSEGLPPELREIGPNGQALHASNQHSRDIFLFSDEFEKTDPKFAPFHIREFDAYLNNLVANHELLHACTNVTREMRHAHALNNLKLFEHVYRIRIWRTAISLLIYSSVDTRTRWTKSCGLDGIRLIYELPWQGAVWHQAPAHNTLYRVGDPFARLHARLSDLSRPGRLVPGVGAGWTQARQA